MVTSDSLTRWGMCGDMGWGARGVGGTRGGGDVGCGGHKVGDIGGETHRVEGTQGVGDIGGGTQGVGDTWCWCCRSWQGMGRFRRWW